MSYTPHIVFDKADLKLDQMKELNESADAGDREALTMRNELMESMFGENTRLYRDTEFVWISPQVTSMTKFYKETLDRWGIEYFEIGA